MLLLNKCVFIWHSVASCALLLTSLVILFSSSTVAASNTDSHWRTYYNTSYSNPLVDAAAAGSLSEVLALIEEGHDVDSVGHFDTTPLMIAAYKGYDDIVKALVEKNATLDTLDDDGATALSLAAISYHADVVRYLIDQGADTSIISDDVFDPPAAVQTRQLSDDEMIARLATPSRRSEPVQRRPSASQPKRISGTDSDSGYTAAGVLAALVVGGAGTAAIIASEDDDDDSRLPPVEIANELAQYGIDSIQAPVAYSRGFTGNGITVAVIDNGVDLDHPDLDGNILPGGFDFADNDSDPSAENEFFAFVPSHGTAVAGVIAAENNAIGIDGVAYNANILPIRFDFFDASNAVNHALQANARVINNSWGDPLTILDYSKEGAEATLGPSLEAYRTAVAQDTIMVFASGNEFKIEPTLEAGLPHYFPELEELWIAAVAVDEFNNIPLFSNFCGVAKDWCIAAPGVNIVTTVDPDTFDDPDRDGYGILDGTSFAAPHVSAAAAILLEAFPGLTGAQVVDLLFTTATDLGAPGVDDEYGHGLINLAAATEPQGQLVIPLGTNVDGLHSRLELSTIQLGQAFGDAITQSPLAFAILDSYQRAYHVDVSDVVSVQRQEEDLIDTLLDFGEYAKRKVVTLGNNALLSYSKSYENKNTIPGQTEATISQASLTKRYKKTDISVHHNVAMEEAFKPKSLGDYAHETALTNGTLNNPYHQFADEGTSVVTSHNIGEDTVVKFAGYQGTDEESEISSRGIVTELSHNMTDNAHISVQAGLISEDNSLLGTETSGAFTTQSNTRTWYYNISGKVDVSEDLSLFGSYNAGLSFPEAGDTSLFQQMSRVRSQAFSVGASLDDIFTEYDAVGFAITQPLRVESGTADVALPIARDAFGNVFLQQTKIGLEPSGREIDFEAFYAVQVGEESMVRTGALLRMEPGHIRGVDPEALFLTKFDHQF